MKRFIFCLLFLVLGIIQLSCVFRSEEDSTTDGAVVWTRISAPSPMIFIDDPTPYSYAAREAAIVDMNTDEQSFLSDDIPLSYEEQKTLQAACKEFDVPYALALGLIDKETNFNNVIGDDGASTGYMQIQKRWHWDRMERLGITDLSDPEGNFRVGCDFLSECRDIYGNWELALTVYNMGHNPGYITKYAYDVLANYEKWLNVVGTDE